ncbi:hypothetical protein OC25_21785 [Pedobacter kyungheensis]|uniref:Uncharacterized protein n=1 Tax=Pedobacter kyungheensis TaxID=1069985 RepID=A0A0C1FE90_9SPHI|nr:hypothetical protein [Pedobacter kyungheensis]KIA91412.1 hypothetical protein OC25_21785 [Pedobacter kyungheensis]
MIRTIITPDKENISIDLPKAYIGKQIEVLVYAVDELNEVKNPKKKHSDFRGSLNLTDQQYKEFQQYIIDSRNEWERDI